MPKKIQAFRRNVNLRTISIPSYDLPGKPVRNTGKWQPEIYDGIVRLLDHPGLRGRQLGIIFMEYGCAEKGHNLIPHQLIDDAFKFSNAFN